MSRGHYWILKGKRPIPVGVLVWARFFESGEGRRVAHDLLDGGLSVSTVFLGIDHRFFGEGPPLLFETMIFRGDGRAAEYQERYSTWDEALAGHVRAIALAMQMQVVLGKARKIAARVKVQKAGVKKDAKKSSRART